MNNETVIEKINKIEADKYDNCLTREEKIGFEEGFNACKDVVIKLLKDI